MLHFDSHCEERVSRSPERSEGDEAIPRCKVRWLRFARNDTCNNVEVVTNHPGISHIIVREYRVKVFLSRSFCFVAKNRSPQSSLYQIPVFSRLLL
jgi:hypothetical protein